MTITTRAAASKDEKAWSLWSLDMRNETWAVFTVRQLDIYFWHREETSFMLQMSMTLPIRSVMIDEEVVHARKLRTPSLVEKLEYAAEEAPSRTSSSSTTASVPDTAAGTSFVPAAYNPASPAAPERIVDREKTPPPADTETNLVTSLTNETALATAQTASGEQQFGRVDPSPHHQTSYSYNPLPTPHTHLSSYQTEPLPSPNAQQVISFAPPPTAQSTTPEQLHNLFSPQAAPSTPPSTGKLPLRHSSRPQPTYPRTQYATYNIPPPPPAPTSVPPQMERSPPGHLHYMGQMYSPGYHAQASPVLYSAGHSQYATPTTGYFGNPSYAGSVPASPYAIHSQVYRPAQGEASHAGHSAERETSGGILRVVDAKAEKVEKGVGKWLKRLDKRS